MNNNIYLLKRLFQTHRYHNCWMKAGTKKSFEWIAMFALVVFLVVPSTIWAQGQRPTCDDDSVNGCINEILIEQDGMIDEVEELLQVMDSTGIFSFVQGQLRLATPRDDLPVELFDRIEGLRRQNARAKEVNDATTDDEYDEMIEEGDKEKGKRCEDSDITFFDSLKGEDPPGFTDVGNKFGNDKCDVFNAKDLDGNAVKVNERAENMCEEACKEKKNAAGNSRKGESKVRLIAGLRDAQFSMSVARQNLSLQRANIAALGAQISQIQLSRVDSP